MLIRLIKTLMLASIALFFSLVAFGNLNDYHANWQFVSHVLAMDTTFHDPAIMSHAITNTAIQKTIYDLIIIWEGLTALICWIGTLLLFKNCQKSRTMFVHAKKTGILGLFMGFLLYVVGFIVIGGEWFSMWQSSIWNGQMTAGLFSMLILFVLLFLSQTEEKT